MRNRVLHVSTECYPMAKAGGMADVVGSLPKYQPQHGWDTSVVIPQYKLPWFLKNELELIYTGALESEDASRTFEVRKASSNKAGFDFYCVSLPGLFDRTSIYLNDAGQGFEDEPERNISFQRAVLQWLTNGDEDFQMIHCHDHQTGFIPFMIKCVEEYSPIKNIPTCYTIHNGAYNSRYAWTSRGLFPSFTNRVATTIEWDHHMDASAAALRYSDHVNTVSPYYLEELKSEMAPLRLFMAEDPERFSGILNGIDEVEWNPRTDPMITHHFERSWDRFKSKNKEVLLSQLYRVDQIPLFSFIGRFAYQKGADLLVPAIERILARFGFVNFYILGSGDKHLEHLVQNVRDRHPERVACYIGYNEEVAHKIYAASDFIIMPSRFEPCGLNQLFAMRYGGLAIARMTGGLVDTVVDFESGGLGVSFTYASSDDLVMAMARALHLYKDQNRFKKIRSRAVKQDFSWSGSAKIYTDKYDKIAK